MAQSNSTALHGYDDESSLDPLASSQFGETKSNLRSCLSPIRSTSQSRPFSTRVLDDITISTPQRTQRATSNAAISPTKSVSEQVLSPWKIRVTVEAEPESAEGGATMGHGRIMKIPLRGSSPATSQTTAPERGRKPKAPSSSSKRRGTPVLRSRNASRTRKQSLTNLDITVLGDDDECETWSPKKQTKSRSRPKSKSKKKEDGSVLEPGKKPEGQHERNQSDDMLKKFDMGSCQSFGDVHGDSAGGVAPDNACEIDEQSPYLKKIDLNRVSLRSRPGSIKRQKISEGVGSISLSPPHRSRRASRFVSGTTENSYPSPTSTVQEEFEAEHKSVDPNESHVGYDTINESEGFTMIDLGSIPSARNFVSTPAEGGTQVQPVRIDTSVDGIQKASLDDRLVTGVESQPVSSASSQTQAKLRHGAIPPHLIPTEGESEISSTVPSSPPMLPDVPMQGSALSLDQRIQQTPAQHSSPKLPSPSKVSAISAFSNSQRKRTSNSPKLARVVKAGIALQGVLSPRQSSSAAPKAATQQSQTACKERLDDLFEGFDAGTRRELRAGLRFGEELAKRQSLSSPSQSIKDLAISQQAPSVWRGETVIQSTQISLPSKTGDMAPKRLVSVLNESLVDAKRHRSSSLSTANGVTATPPRQVADPRETSYLDTQARERVYQLEREAISRQIENASTSQVIVIDSDEETEVEGDACDGDSVGDPVNETDGDIWLAEAKDLNTSKTEGTETDPDPFPPSEQELQRQRAKEAVRKPRRSLIPSPWRRGENTDDGATTLMTNGDGSGLFWAQPNEEVRFGAKLIREKRQQSSNATRSSLRDNAIIDSEIDELGLHLFAPISRLSVCDRREILNESQVDNGSGGHIENSSFCVDEHNKSMTPYDESSLPPQPIKIPVNFNDSTLSNVAPPLQRPSSSASSSRPGTPRSAMKGSRISLGFEADPERRVAFSKKSCCVDESGLESSLELRGASPTPATEAESGISQKEPPTTAPSCIEASTGKSKSWFGWLWGGKSSAHAPAAVPPTGAGSCLDVESDPWQPNSRTTTSPSLVQEQQELPSYLRPPSYPSDPSRDLSFPLATSGTFTDPHFRTLHIIYRKSIRPRFHAPMFGKCRPGLKGLLGRKFECEEDEGGYGVFEWKVDEVAVTVLERFYQEVELGWDLAGKDMQWGWKEEEVAWWLFRVVVGEEIRREQRHKVGL